MKVIRPIQWVFKNKVDNDPLPDTCELQYEIRGDGEFKRASIQFDMELTPELIQLFLEHVRVMKVKEGF